MRTDNTYHEGNNVLNISVSWSGSTHRRQVPCTNRFSELVAEGKINKRQLSAVVERERQSLVQQLRNARRRR